MKQVHLFKRLEISARLPIISLEDGELGFLSDFMVLFLMCALYGGNHFKFIVKSCFWTIFTILYLVCIAYHKSLKFDGKRFIFTDIK